MNTRACACGFARVHWTDRGRWGQRQLPGVRGLWRWGRHSPCPQELVAGRAYFTTRASVSSVSGAGQQRSTRWLVRGHRGGVWRSVACETDVTAGSGCLSAGCRACSEARHRSACEGPGRGGVASRGDLGRVLPRPAAVPESSLGSGSSSLVDAEQGPWSHLGLACPARAHAGL